MIKTKIPRKARKEAAQTYQPVLIVLNAVYLILRYLLKGLADFLPSWKEWLGIFLLLALQGFSYTGILENAANQHNASSSPTSSQRLVGGIYLDVLGLAALIQFLSILWSPRWYGLLVIFPLWGLYSLYRTVRGDGGSIQSSTNNSCTSNDKSSSITETSTDDGRNNRRQQRAEKRRQKWS